MGPARFMPVFRYERRDFRLEVYADRIEVWDAYGTPGILTGTRWVSIRLAHVTSVGALGPQLRIATWDGKERVYDLGPRSTGARLAIEEMR